MKEQGSVAQFRALGFKLPTPKCSAAVRCRSAGASDSRQKGERQSEWFCAIASSALCAPRNGNRNRLPLEVAISYFEYNISDMCKEPRSE